MPFSSQLIGDYGDERIAAILYALNIAGLSATGAVMVLYAFRHDLVKTDLARRLGIDAGPASWLVPAVFLASIPVALIGAEAVEYSWLALFLLGAVLIRGFRSRETGQLS